MINNTGGAITIDFDGTEPEQPIIPVLAEQLTDTAYDELNAAIEEEITMSGILA